MSFSQTPLEIPLLFLTDPWHFHMLSSIHLEIPRPQPLTWIFSEIAQYKKFADKIGTNVEITNNNQH